MSRDSLELQSALLEEPRKRSVPRLRHGRASDGPQRRCNEDNIKVCIRVRPLSDAESNSGQTNIVLCSPRCEESLQLVVPEEFRVAGTPDRGATNYNFDWVLSGQIPQERVYGLVGKRVVSGVADGFHGCVFAYGQTGSGKSYTIFGGSGEDRGLLPRIAEGLYAEMDRDNSQYIIKFSYLEIYNEKLRDLLRPAVPCGDVAPTLEVRQHPKVGVFVEGLTSNVVRNAKDVARLLDFGHKLRVVGSTNMNAASSRSHALVTLHVERAIDRDGGARRLRRRAQLHAVDLAGSERMKHVGVGESKVQQRESKQINKSLWALSLTISRLSQEQANGTMAAAHIPYRNSKLTYLLSESLMGNCRTVMLACTSSATSSFPMTDSTLRFASSVKQIKTRPVQNEEIDGDLIGALRMEVESLRRQLDRVGAEQRKALFERIETTQLLQRELGASWEDQLAQSLIFERDRHQTLQRLGLSSSNLASAWKRGQVLHVRTDADPYLVNVCDDPLLSGCLAYTLPRDEVVRVGSDASCAIQIDGAGITPHTCSLRSVDGLSAELSVNSGEKLDAEQLCSGPRASKDTKPRGTVIPCEGGSISSMSTAPSSLSNSDRPGGYSGSGLVSEDADKDSDELIQHCTSWTGQRSKTKTRKSSLCGAPVAQVYVNNEIVSRQRQLMDGDRVRIGQRHVFHLFIPQSHAQEQEARNKSDSHLMDLISHITPASSEQILAKEYASHLRQRVGKEFAETVFRQLYDLQPLIDEANSLADEMRGHDEHELVFKAHVLSDVTSSDSPPEVAVALRLVKRPDEIAVGGKPVFSGDSPVSSLHTVWSMQRFLSRLESMRHLHQEVSNRDQPWGHLNVPDPWREEDSIPVNVSGFTESKERLPPVCYPEPDEEPIERPTHQSLEFGVADNVAKEALFKELSSTAKELEHVRAELDVERARAKLESLRTLDSPPISSVRSAMQERLLTHRSCETDPFHGEADLQSPFPSTEFPWHFPVDVSGRSPRTSFTGLTVAFRPQPCLRSVHTHSWPSLDRSAQSSCPGSGCAALSSARQQLPWAMPIINVVNSRTGSPVSPKVGRPPSGSQSPRPWPSPCPSPGTPATSLQRPTSGRSPSTRRLSNTSLSTCASSPPLSENKCYRVHAPSQLLGSSSVPRPVALAPRVTTVRPFSPGSVKTTSKTCGPFLPSTPVSAGPPVALTPTTPVRGSVENERASRFGNERTAASRRVRSCEIVEPPVGGWAHARKHVVLDEIRRLQQELEMLEGI
uniref:Kinesin motor domain-containing protein n=1 Tax=Noctiluca scintillans TaxID=2966 RepID=A0A7S1ARQ8_NOCSC